MGGRLPRHRATLPALLTGCLLTTGLCGCAGDDTSADGNEGTYVAIGDSYTAAPGTGPPDKSDDCLRSTSNYPHLIAEQTGMELRDVSCAAATTEAVEGEQDPPQGSTLRPQLDAVDEDTDLVTVRIGANDFNLIGRVVIDCVQVASVEPAGSPCAALDSAADDSVASRLGEVEQRVLGVLEAIRERAPGARIIAIGYPQIFPARGGCGALPLAEGDVDFARRVNKGINRALSDAAADAGVDFIDVFATTAGHDICGEHPWIAGSTAVPGQGVAYHPYAEEAVHVAGLVQAAIR